MLKLTFSVSFDRDLKVKEIYRNCNVPRPTCEGCKFKEMCDKMEKAFIYAVIGKADTDFVIKS